MTSTAAQFLMHASEYFRQSTTLQMVNMEATWWGREGAGSRMYAEQILSEAELGLDWTDLSLGGNHVTVRMGLVAMLAVVAMRGSVWCCRWCGSRDGYPSTRRAGGESKAPYSSSGTSSTMARRIPLSWRPMPRKARLDLPPPPPPPLMVLPVLAVLRLPTVPIQFIGSPCLISCLCFLALSRLFWLLRFLGISVCL